MASLHLLPHLAKLSFRIRMNVKRFPRNATSPKLFIHKTFNDNYDVLMQNGLRLARSNDLWRAWGKGVCNQDEHGITHMFARQIDCKMLVWNFNSIDLRPSTQMAKLHVRAYKIGFSWQFQFHVGHKVHCAAVRGGQEREGTSAFGFHK